MMNKTEQSSVSANQTTMSRLLSPLWTAPDNDLPSSRNCEIGSTVQTQDGICERNQSYRLSPSCNFSHTGSTAGP